MLAEPARICGELVLWLSKWGKGGAVDALCEGRPRSRTTDVVDKNAFSVAPDLRSVCSGSFY
jgi:hypothetical protein